jgi:hypothetical protein
MTLQQAAGYQNLNQHREDIPPQQAAGNYQVKSEIWQSAMTWVVKSAPSDAPDGHRSAVCQAETLGGTS